VPSLAFSFPRPCPPDPGTAITPSLPATEPYHFLNINKMLCQYYLKTSPPMFLRFSVSWKRIASMIPNVPVPPLGLQGKTNGNVCLFLLFLLPTAPSPLRPNTPRSGSVEETSRLFPSLFFSKEDCTHFRSLPLFFLRPCAFQD